VDKLDTRNRGSRYRRHASQRQLRRLAAQGPCTGLLLVPLLSGGWWGRQFLNKTCTRAPPACGSSAISGLPTLPSRRSPAAAPVGSARARARTSKRINACRCFYLDKGPVPHQKQTSGFICKCRRLQRAKAHPRAARRGPPRPSPGRQRPQATAHARPRLPLPGCKPGPDLTSHVHADVKRAP